MSDYRKQAPVYDKGRWFPDETIAAWMDAARTAVGNGRVRRTIDVGSGTGRFSANLAMAFGSQVIALEPSTEMQQVAAAKPRQNVSLVAGRAESLPIADASCDVAWLSNVIHHVDMRAAAMELRRVIAADGVVLIRGHMRPGHTYSLYGYFEDVQASSDLVDVVDGAVEQLKRAQFSSCSRFVVQQLTAASLRELQERASHRADSALQRLNDEAFHEGLARLDAAADRHPADPVIDEMELLAIS